MPNIKIVAVPSGEAPLKVREQWVGLVLPVSLDYEGWRRMGFISQKGVLGGLPDQENLEGYPVNAKEAILILNNKSPEAANWWWSLPSFESMDYFIFGKKFCELVS